MKSNIIKISYFLLIKLVKIIKIDIIFILVMKFFRYTIFFYIVEGRFKLIQFFGEKCYRILLREQLVMSFERFCIFLLRVLECKVCLFFDVEQFLQLFIQIVIQVKVRIENFVIVYFKSGRGIGLFVGSYNVCFLLKKCWFFGLL